MLVGFHLPVLQYGIRGGSFGSLVPVQVVSEALLTGIDLEIKYTVVRRRVANHPKSGEPRKLSDLVFLVTPTLSVDPRRTLSQRQSGEVVYDLRMHIRVCKQARWDHVSLTVVDLGGKIGRYVEKPFARNKL